MPADSERRACYIGLMSGTSMDGIDAALVEFGDRNCTVLATQSNDYPDALRRDLWSASRNPESCTVDRIGRLDQWVGECFRDAALGVMAAGGVEPADVTAIGSHGQTLRHQPRADKPYTLQIGNPNVITAGTGVATVADFRRADMALGGEGAPLAPAFHAWLFGGGSEPIAAINIGGIANVTLLPAADGRVQGFDTGPGNTLMDAVARQHLDCEFDEDGVHAAMGKVSTALLDALLADPYFREPPPKSTGFEYFDMAWLDARLSASGVAEMVPADLLATLCELTARSIADAAFEHAPGLQDAFVCGGGAHNPELMRRLREALAPASVATTSTVGLAPEWVEAAAFAWLAMRRVEGLPGNLPDVTGATAPAVLGAVYCANRHE